LFTVVLVFVSCSPFPPREQLLMAAVGGAVVLMAFLILLPSASASHPTCYSPCEQALAAVCHLVSLLVHRGCNVAGGAYLPGSPRCPISIVPPFPLPSSSSPSFVAPAIHPASSCSQGWRRALGHHRFVVVSLPVRFVPLLPFPYPPHEQRAHSSGGAVAVPRCSCQLEARINSTQPKEERKTIS